MKIRLMTLADLETLIAIQAQAHRPEFQESRESYACKLNRAGETAWLAVDESGNALGFCLALAWQRGLPPPDLNADKLPLLEWSDCLYLHDLAVLPEASGQGVGSSLVETVWAKTLSLGLAGIVLVSLADSVGWWRRQGWCEQPGEAVLTGYGSGALLMFRETGLGKAVGPGQRE